MVPACQLCSSVGGGFRKGTMASGPLSVWEKAVHQGLALMLDTSVSLCMSLMAFQAATLALELRGSESE